MGEGVVGSNFPWKTRFYISAYASVFSWLKEWLKGKMLEVDFQARELYIYRSSEGS